MEGWGNRVAEWMPLACPWTLPEGPWWCLSLHAALCWGAAGQVATGHRASWACSPRAPLRAPLALCCGLSSTGPAALGPSSSLAGGLCTVFPWLLPRHHGGDERAVGEGELVQDPAGTCCFPRAVRGRGRPGRLGSSSRGAGAAGCSRLWSCPCPSAAPSQLQLCAPSSAIMLPSSRPGPQLPCAPGPQAQSWLCGHPTATVGGVCPTAVGHGAALCLAGGTQGQSCQAQRWVPAPWGHQVPGAAGPAGAGIGRSLWHGSLGSRRGQGGRAPGSTPLPARRRSPGCVSRAITEMAPISSDCWKPAQTLSQRVPRVSHRDGWRGGDHRHGMGRAGWSRGCWQRA